MEILDVVDETGAPTGETVERADTILWYKVKINYSFSPTTLHRFLQKAMP